MAVITGEASREDFLKGGGNKFYIVLESDAATPDDSVELTVPEFLPHGFVGVQMFDASGEPVVASAGTFTVQVKTINTDQFEDIPDESRQPGATISANNPKTLSWGGNVTLVRITVSGLTGVATWKVVVTLNRS